MGREKACHASLSRSVARHVAQESDDSRDTTRLHAGQADRWLASEISTCEAGRVARIVVRSALLTARSIVSARFDSRNRATSVRVSAASVLAIRFDSVISSAARTRIAASSVIVASRIDASSRSNASLDDAMASSLASRSAVIFDNECAAAASAVRPQRMKSAVRRRKRRERLQRGYPAASFLLLQKLIPMGVF